MTTAVWWVRRDLRLADNQALASALQAGDQVIPVFILDPRILGSENVARSRLAFLLDGLRRLDSALRERGSRLIVRQGLPQEQLAALLSETDATALFAEEDISPYARRRDEEVRQRLPLHLCAGLTLQSAGAVVKADGKPFTVFTPFNRRWRARPLPAGQTLLPAPRHIATPASILSLPIPAEPALPTHVPFPAGEAEAQRRLSAFVSATESAIARYGWQRDRLDLAGTSELSPYLRFGMLSARQAAVAAVQARDNAGDAAGAAGADTWLGELIWREFYLSVLDCFPDVQRQAFRPELRAIAWENDETAFAAWCEGLTGYPVVDAGMRQLAHLGWMHNRARMIVASFLVKDLLIDWRWGESWFMQHLVDGEPASNSGGWQWSAGVGTDAAPYFRVFNPVVQGMKHDPEGAYVRRWVPELAHVPAQYAQQPWRMPEDVQRKAGCRVGKEYPAPIVEHGWARTRAMEAYRQARAAGVKSR